MTHSTHQIISETIFLQVWWQNKVSKQWRRAISHPDSSQSHHAHLTMLQ